MPKMVWFERKTFAWASWLEASFHLSGTPPPLRALG